MGNFTRRAIAFILGMVVGIVTLFGGIAGAMYWAFKNLTLSKLGVMQEDESGFGDTTIEELVALVMLAQGDPESFTIQKLEEQGLDLLKLLEKTGVDFSKADAIDYAKLKDISPLLLFSSKGLNELSFSTIFALLPKGDDGNYPLFSYGARNMLRGYSLGYLLANDEASGQMRLFTEMGGLKIGSLFPKTFTETYSEEKCEYTYTAENPALEKLGNLKISLITNNVKGESAFNLGYELNEGELKEIGDDLLVNFLADLIAGNDETAKEETKQSLALFDGVFVKELFKYNEESETYKFNAEVLLNGFSMGKFMGYTNCTESETCPIHQDVNNCDGEWYEKCTNSETCPIHSDSGCEGKEEYKKLSGDTAEELITQNLITLGIDDIMGGNFNISNLVDGVYLGHSLGYKIASSESVAIPSGFCDKNCEFTEEHEKHTYYWLNDENVYVGKLYNDVSNMLLANALNGEGLDLEGTINGNTFGELMGYVIGVKDGYCSENCSLFETDENHKHKYYWVDKNGDPVDSVTAMDKIMLSIYDKTMNEISNGTLKLEDMLKGIKLGELMSYTYEEGVWKDKNGNDVKFTKFDKTLYETNVEELVGGQKDFKAILSGLYVGELMGNSYDKENDVWYDENGNEIELDILEKTIYKVEVSALLNNKVNFKQTLEHLYVGQLMGYSIGEKDGYCSEDCANTEEGHKHKYYWLKDSVKVSNLDMTVADIKLEEIFIGEINFKQKIDNLTLGDVIDVNDSDTPTILKLLEDSPISQLSSDINKMYLGEVMGYTLCTSDATCTVHDNGETHDGKWHKEDEVVTGLNAKIANYTFNSFATDGFNASEFTLGDVITAPSEYQNGSIFSLLDVGEIDVDGDGEKDYDAISGSSDVEKRKNIPVSQVSARVKSGVTKASLAKLMECEVFLLGTTEQNKLDNAFKNTGTDWRNLTLQQFISTVVAMLPD